MNVLMLSPGYPAEMPHFARGLAAVGARVIGLGDQPAQALPEMARASARAPTCSVPALWDEEASCRRGPSACRAASASTGSSACGSRGMVLAARLREAPRRARHDVDADGAVPRQGAR